MIASGNERAIFLIYIIAQTARTIFYLLTYTILIPDSLGRGIPSVFLEMVFRVSSVEVRSLL